MPSSALRPFRIDVPDAVLADLRRRLDDVRWPPVEPRNAGWRYGANPGYMRRLVDYWRHGFDWRRAEAALNRFPHYTAALTAAGPQPLDLHFIHERGSGKARLPLIVTHGWPGSIAEFIDVIEPLAHPECFGGAEADAFDVVAPSLPGYGFSAAPPEPMGPRAMAELLRQLMVEVLGYRRFGAQGGDWGSLISAWLALDHPDAVRAIHLNMVPLRPHLGAGAPPLTAEERDWIGRAQAQLKPERAYQDIQATKSQSLAYGLTDSPVALSAWITEKFHGWSDRTAAEPPFTMDQILTNVMIYWATGCINSSTWPYRAVREEASLALPPDRRIETPMGFCLPPNDLALAPPDSWLKRLGNVVHRTDLAEGGHFVALQKGPELVEDIRAFFRPFRTP